MLQRLFDAPGATITGYGDDGRIELSAGTPFHIGRVNDCELRIDQIIGGRRTYVIDWRDPEWTLRVMNEWAVVRINGETLAGLFPRRALHDGDVVEICAGTPAHPLVHRLRVEIRSS